MTTPTPTSNPLPAGQPESLIDVAQLAQLANQFFSALPGEATSSASPAVSNAQTAVPVLPTAATPSENFSQPKVVPNAITPTGVPDVASGVPATSGRPGGVALGVPEAYAASLPNADIPSAFPSLPEAGISAPASIPFAPYYFLGEGSVAPSAMPAALEGEDRVTAQSFVLPGVGDLRAVLDTLNVAPIEQQKPAFGTSFYFLDPTNVPLVSTSGIAPFDVHAVRRDFPILSERLKNGKQLIWLDNAATTHKPQAVIDRLAYFYQHENSNIHRAAHELAARATDAYEAARNKVAKFIGASSPQEIIFVRGATEAINLVAQSWGRQNIQAGDEIIVSHLEHHANIVPWQRLVAEKGAKLRVIPVDDSGQVLLDEYKKLLNDKTKLVSVTQVSNALGTVVPVKEIVELAHRAGALALVDGAQSVPHLRVNVQSLDADFFVFSGHKIFAPTGIGVVYGKKSVLDNMPPWQAGGNMIADVTFEKTIYQDAPARFEAGTGNIADAVGLGAAVDYLERIGFENAARYEHGVHEYATLHLKTVPGLRLIGTAAEKASVLSFVLDGYTTEEVGKALNEEGIAVRSGHHCAQPILRRFGLEATVRPSLAFYNTCEEVDALVNVVRRLSASRPVGRKS